MDRGLRLAVGAAWLAAAVGLAIAGWSLAGADPRPVYATGPNVPGYVCLGLAAIALTLGVARLLGTRRVLLRHAAGALAAVVLVTLVVGIPALQVRSQSATAEPLEGLPGARLDPLSRASQVTIGDTLHVATGGALLVLGRDGPLGRLDGVGVGTNALVAPDGRVLLTSRFGRAELHPPPRDPQGASEPLWRFEASDVEPLGIDGDTVLLLDRRRCGADAGAGCEDRVRVLGVRDGRAVWARAVDDAAPLAYGAGGPVSLSTTAVVAAPGLGLAFADGELVGFDRDGRVALRAGDVVAPDDVATLAVDGDRVTVLARDEDTVVPTLLAPGEAPVTRRPLPAGEPVVLPGVTYLPARGRAGGTGAVGPELAGSRLPDVPGVAGFSPRSVVGGEGGVYRALRTADGRELWRTAVDHADPEDRPLGTGLTAVSDDTALVASSLERRWQWRALTGARARVSLLDLDSGERLAEWVVPGGGQVSQLFALGGHTGLVLLADGSLHRLDGS